LGKLTEWHEKQDVIAEKHDQRFGSVSPIGHGETSEDVVVPWRRVKEFGALKAVVGGIADTAVGQTDALQHLEVRRGRGRFGNTQPELVAV
jgi:hypothetical protein